MSNAKHRGTFRHWNSVWALWYRDHPIFNSLDTSDVAYGTEATGHEMAEFCFRRHDG